MITKEKILDWFVWAMIAVVAILFLLKIFGDSPTLEQQVFGVFTTFLVLFYRDLQNAKSRINKDLQEIKEKLGEHSAKLEHLTEIRQELKNHKH